MVDNHIPFSEISESSSGQTIHQDTQTRLDSKSTNRIVSNNTKTPLTADFPLGWFVDINNTNTITKLANEGFNIVMPYVGKSDDEKIKTYLDAAEMAGIKVLLELPRSIVIKEDTDRIIEFVHKFKNHPAVFAWYCFDEPELKKLPPTTLRKAYKAIKTEDLDKPVVVVFARLWGIEKYLDALDIFMWDQYPVTHGSPEFGSPDWYKMNSWFKRAASHSRAFGLLYKGMAKSPMELLSLASVCQLLMKSDICFIMQLYQELMGYFYGRIIVLNNLGLSL